MYSGLYFCVQRDHEKYLQLLWVEPGGLTVDVLLSTYHLPPNRDAVAERVTEILISAAGTRLILPVPPEFRNPVTALLALQ